MLFRLYTSWSYWKHEVLTLDAFKEYMFFVGVAHSLRPLLKFTNIYQSIDIYFLPITLGVCAIITLFRKRPKGTVCYNIYGTDASIEIISGDLFKQSGAIVIPSNTSFDTEVNEQLISQNSIQGQFTKKILFNDINLLNRDIDCQLKNIQCCGKRLSKVGGKNKLYKVGTTVEIKDNNNDDDKTTKYYLVAMADLNEFGIASTDNEKLVNALNGLWEFISTKSSRPNIVNIPLLGTSFGRSNLKYYHTIILIAISYIKNRLDCSFVNKVRIVILDDIFFAHYEEIQCIQPIIKEICQAPSLLNILSFETK